ncbi:MAG: hypothetical protein R2722_01815 [Tessaracoccus sp.]
MATTELDQSVPVLNVLTDLPVTKEATTSRVLVNNPLLRVVDFAFDEGQLLTEHSSPRAVVVTLLSGTMDFDIEGRPTWRRATCSTWRRAPITPCEPPAPATCSW